MAMEQQTFTDRDAAEAACAAWLGARLAAALGGATVGRRVALLVSGGATPARLLPRLLRRDLDWTRIDTIASDERLVAVDHPDSTEGMLARLFRAAGRPLNHAGPGGETDPAAALAAWRAARRGIAWPPAAGLLGIGADAHIASLFPSRPEALDDDLRDAAVPETPPHRHPRLTLGLGLLGQCRGLALVAADAGKHRALAQSLQNPPGWPLGRLAARAPITVFRTPAAPSPQSCHFSGNMPRLAPGTVKSQPCG
jgi:6-phosphogluconolactonase